MFIDDILTIATTFQVFGINESSEGIRLNEPNFPQ